MFLLILSEFYRNVIANEDKRGPMFHGTMLLWLSETFHSPVESQTSTMPASQMFIEAFHKLAQNEHDTSTERAPAPRKALPIPTTPSGVIFPSAL